MNPTDVRMDEGTPSVCPYVRPPRTNVPSRNLLKCIYTVDCILLYFLGFADFDRDNQLGKQDMVNTIRHLTRCEMTLDEVQFIVSKVRYVCGWKTQG